MSLTFLANPPPATAPSFWDYSQGKRLAWNEYGDPEGAPVFYYHGWPSSRLQARLAHHLAKNRGLRLIAMDRPGMGRSTLIPGRRLEEWPGLMEGFADHLGIAKFGQIGVSGGGPYVLACAAMIPDRLTGSAVLAGMVPLPLTKSGTSGLHPLYRMMIPIRKSPAPLFSGLFRIAAHISGGKPDSFLLSVLVRSLAEEDRAILLSSSEVWEVATKSFIESVSTEGCGRGVISDSEIYFQKPSFDPSAITHPIRYWHGGDDKNIPAALVDELVSTMPNAELCVEQELGHFSLAVHRAAAALDYIASCANGESCPRPTSPQP
jgi:pimeloyl-ACP methyl ester carboxylesterase